jgi:hypothetical protein
MQERLAMLDDGLANAEEHLAEKREAELRARTKEIVGWLPVITAQLGLLWHEVTGSGRPTPSGMQRTTTGSEMTTEEHVATAETHLRYAEGHLQLSEEHLADAEVHLKLVRAHLAVLEPAEQVEVNLIEMVSPPIPEAPTEGTGAASTAAQEVTNRRAEDRRRSRSGTSASAASRIERTRRLEPGATSKPAFGDTVC